MINEWNAIDLHMHTLSGVTGDAKTDEVCNFTYENFLKAIKKFKLKLISITNHNIIDMKNYIICRYLTKKIGTNLLLGVEIDTESSQKINYHMVMIFNETLNNGIKVAKEINEMTKNKKINGLIRYTADEIIDLLGKYNMVIIPHGDKSKGMFNRPTQEQLEDALKKIKEGFIRVFDNSPSDWKLAQIKKVINDDKLYSSIDDFGGVLFSDNRDWLKYDLKCKNFYMHAEPTFKGFLHSITNPTKRFSTEESIKVNSNYIAEIQINQTDEKNRLLPCTIKFLNGFNCVIGKSGSGKSLLLNIISKKLVNSENDKYDFINMDDIRIFNEFGNELEPSNVNVGIGESIFDKIISASNPNNSEDMSEVIKLLKPNFIFRKKFKKYIEYYKNKIKDYITNKDIIEDTKDDLALFNSFQSNELELGKMKDIIPFSIETPNLYEVEYNDVEIKKLNELITKIKEINDIIDILKKDDAEKIKLIMKELEKEVNVTFNNIYKRISMQKYINAKINIINASIIRVNSSISNNFERKKVIMSGIHNTIRRLVEIFKKRYIAKIKLQTYDLSINLEDINNNEIIIEKEKISISEELPEKFVKEMDIRKNEIFYTYGSQKYLSSKLYDMTNNENAREVIDTYYACGIINDDFINKMFVDIKLDINVFFDNQNVKQLNPGDIAKKYIQYYFNCQLTNELNTIILYDQIENDVDKSFISNTIIDLIEDMQMKAQVIIVTHDPIVAVNADPINYIEAIKDDENKIIYRNFVPESNECDELETIAVNVDGSKQVIKERYEIYRGELNYEN